MSTTGEPTAGGGPDATPETTKKPWSERVEAFAIAVTKTPEEIENALKPLVGEPGEDALAALSNPEAVLDSDLQDVLVGELKIPLGIFRIHLPKLRGPQIAVKASQESGVGSSEFLLPNVPDDESFLGMLKVGGNLKVENTEVISTIKAALASKVGLFDLPKTLAERMEKFAEEQSEPVGKDFFTLRNMLTTRSYGEVLSVLDIKGNFMSEKRKNDFLKKLDKSFWSTILGFHEQLRGWTDSWMAGMSNPGAMLALLASQGKPGGVLPPGLMQPPETSTVRDAAESVIDEINRVFGGLGIPVARALAYDATQIKKVLQEPSLPMSIGASNYEQMLKTLNLDVKADYVRLERNLTRYVLAIMEVPKIPSGTEEYSYFTAMLQLGTSIPWDQLPVQASFGVGSSIRDTSGNL